MLIEREHCALVLIDYQARLMPLMHEAQATLDKALFLARMARLLEVPVIGTEQNPLRLGENEPAIRALCQQTLTKDHFSAVPDGLPAVLQAAGPRIRQIVLGGCESHVCLLQTALELQASGLRCAVVPSACSSRQPADHALAMQRLQQAGVVLASAESVAFEWLRHCRHPRFKEALALIKPRGNGGNGSS